MKQVIQAIKDIIKLTEFENKVYLAGGYVRDEILGVPSKDIDLVVNMPNGGIKLAEYFCNSELHLLGVKKGQDLVIFQRYGTAKFTFMGQAIECVAPRKEVYSEDSRKPITIEGTLLQDALRRDFTINALFKNISTGEILDLTSQGLGDIKRGIITTPLDPDITFSDDPLRMLRAVRFSIKYDFPCTLSLNNSMLKNAHRLEIISKERITDEFSKMLLFNTPSQAIIKLENRGLLKYIIPELEALRGVKQGVQHFGDVWEHTLKVLDNTKPNLTLRLSALLHDIAKPKTRTETETGVHFYKHDEQGAEMAETILKRLKYSNNLIEDVKFLIKEHMRTKCFGNELKTVKDKAIRRLVHDSGTRRELLFGLIHADNLSHAEDFCMPNQIPLLIKRIEGLNLTEKVEIKLPINGKDIMERYNLPQGKEIGEMLNYLRNYIYGTPDLTKEEALNICNLFYKKMIKNN